MELSEKDKIRAEIEALSTRLDALLKPEWPQEGDTIYLAAIMGDSVYKRYWDDGYQQYAVNGLIFRTGAAAQQRLDFLKAETRLVAACKAGGEGTYSFASNGKNKSGLLSSCHLTTNCVAMKNIIDTMQDDIQVWLRGWGDES